MIKVVKNKDIITISGHANYSDKGTDIVCASVSSIVLTTVNSVMNIDKESILYTDDGNVITIKKLNSNDIVDTLLKTMIELLKDLSLQYKNNIKVESEE